MHNDFKDFCFHICFYYVASNGKIFTQVTWMLIIFTAFPNYRSFAIFIGFMNELNWQPSIHIDNMNISHPHVQISHVALTLIDVLKHIHIGHMETLFQYVKISYDVSNWMQRQLNIHTDHMNSGYLHVWPLYEALNLMLERQHIHIEHIYM